MLFSLLLIHTITHRQQQAGQTSTCGTGSNHQTFRLVDEPWSFGAPKAPGSLCSSLRKLDELIKRTIFRLCLTSVCRQTGSNTLPLCIYLCSAWPVLCVCSFSSPGLNHFVSVVILWLFCVSAVVVSFYGHISCLKLFCLHLWSFCVSLWSVAVSLKLLSFCISLKSFCLCLFGHFASLCSQLELFCVSRCFSSLCGCFLSLMVSLSHFIGVFVVTLCFLCLWLVCVRLFGQFACLWSVWVVLAHSFAALWMYFVSFKSFGLCLCGQFVVNIRCRQRARPRIPKV